MLFATVRVPHAETTISYNGSSYWLNGINVPWNHFGADDGIYTIAEQLANAYNNDYAGVLFWSYNSDWADQWDACKAELKAFRDAHAGIVDFAPSTTVSAGGTVSYGSAASPLRLVAVVGQAAHQGSGSLFGLDGRSSHRAGPGVYLRASQDARR